MGWTYADAIGRDDQVGGGGLAVLKGDGAGFGVDIGGLVVDLERALRALTGRFKGGLDQLLVDVDAVEVVVVLGCQYIRLVSSGRVSTDRAELALVVAQAILVLHRARLPVVHDQFLENHLE